MSAEPADGLPKPARRCDGMDAGRIRDEAESPTRDRRGRRGGHRGGHVRAVAGVAGHRDHEPIVVDSPLPSDRLPTSLATVRMIRAAHRKVGRVDDGSETPSAASQLRSSLRSDRMDRRGLASPGFDHRWPRLDRRDHAHHLGGRARGQHRDQRGFGPGDHPVGRTRAERSPDRRACQAWIPKRCRNRRRHRGAGTDHAFRHAIATDHDDGVVGLQGREHAPGGGTAAGSVGFEDVHHAGHAVDDPSANTRASSYEEATAEDSGEARAPPRQHASARVNTYQRMPRFSPRSTRSCS